MLYAPSLRRTAAVVRNRGYVFNECNIKTGNLQSSCGFTVTLDGTALTRTDFTPKPGMVNPDGNTGSLVLKNLTPADVAESCEALVKELDAAQILMLPGGFSGGDEPDGSAKFITAFFRSPAVADAVNRLLQQRDGLALGICNGFQALIKLGLVPYGEIRSITANDPTLTFNTVGRHQSMLVRTRIASNKSPWLSECDVNDEHLIAISHGEGRFVCNDQLLQQLIENGQIATQYVDLNCVPTMDQRYNPNGSVLAIEGITSPDGRVLGKMGHTERSGKKLYKNVTGDKYQPLFEGGVNYFKL